MPQDFLALPEFCSADGVDTSRRQEVRGAGVVRLDWVTGNPNGFSRRIHET